MIEKKTSQQDIKERLQEAIDGLRKDATRVEIWATALGTFAEPIPDYQPDAKFRLGGAGSAATGEPKKSGNRT